MKYLLLSYTPAAAWDAATADTPSEEAMAAFAAYQKFEQELTETGEFVSSEGLGHPTVSTTVRRTQDGVVATDGPFAELKEVLASIAVIDVASQEQPSRSSRGSSRCSVSRSRSGRSWTRTSRHDRLHRAMPGKAKGQEGTRRANSA